jgi:hypothetical protein
MWQIILTVAELNGDAMITELFIHNLFFLAEYNLIFQYIAHASLESIHFTCFTVYLVFSEESKNYICNTDAVTNVLLSFGQERRWTLSSGAFCTFMDQRRQMVL